MLADMTKPDQQADEILDKALELAEIRSWEKLRLHDIAAELDMSLDVIRQYYSQKDDLVEAWYDRADSAMLQYAHDMKWDSQDMPTRYTGIIMSWLGALAAHRKVSGEMLLYKLEPGHFHLQALGLLRISRTVQWFIEAAESKTTHLLRIAEEISLTSIFLATFSYWLMDNSAESTETRKFLNKRLTQLDSIAGILLRPAPDSPDLNTNNNRES